MVEDVSECSRMVFVKVSFVGLGSGAAKNFLPCGGVLTFELLISKMYAGISRRCCNWFTSTDIDRICLDLCCIINFMNYGILEDWSILCLEKLEKAMIQFIAGISLSISVIWYNWFNIGTGFWKFNEVFIPHIDEAVKFPLLMVCCNFWSADLMVFPGCVWITVFAASFGGLDIYQWMEPWRGN
nr:hypothetical protein [Tanacetum cinerariifolium]